MQCVTEPIWWRWDKNSKTLDIFNLLTAVYFKCLQNQENTRGVATGFGHHGMPPPECNNIAAILLMSWATLLPIFIILRLFVLELWAGRVRHTMWPCDLWSWRSWWWLVMRGFVLHLYTKFEFRRPYHSEDIRHFVCENKSICDLELWTFWPWSWCGTLHVSCWNFLPILIFLRLFIL